MRLSRALNEFLDHCRLDRSPETVRGYEGDLQILVGLAQGTATDSIQAFTSKLAAAYFTAQREKNMAPGTLHRRQTALNEFARWAVKRRYLTENPMDALPVFKRPRHLPRPFAKHERDALLALELGLQDRCVRGLLAFAALRVSECANLRVRDITFGAPADGVAGLLRVLGKGRKERAVPMLPELDALLREYVTTVSRLIHPSEPLFARRNGRPWDRRLIERRTQEWGRQAGVPDCTPHRFRHSVATLLLERGVNIVFIQQILGHSDPGTTMIYTKVHQAQVIEAMMRLSDTPSAGQPG